MLCCYFDQTINPVIFEAVDTGHIAVHFYSKKNNTFSFAVRVYLFNKQKTVVIQRVGETRLRYLALFQLVCQLCSNSVFFIILELNILKQITIQRVLL